MVVSLDVIFTNSKYGDESKGGNMILYANADQLLNEKNSNGITIRRWNNDRTAIILKSGAELQAGLDALHLTLKNEHGIALWKQSGDQVIERTSEEIAADEAVYIVTHFDSKTFFGRLIQQFTAERWFTLSKLGVGWTMQQLVDYPNFAGLKAYANGLLMDGTIQEADALIINACLLEQGIDLTNF